MLFRQVRLGLHGRPFEPLKFRTLPDARGAGGALRPDAERPTRFGEWLRRTSLDELREPINLLRGGMSLIGPRHLLVDHCSADRARRHEVRLGSIDRAAVPGRNRTSRDRRLALDVGYVDLWSLGLDLNILLMRVARVRQREGIGTGGHATLRRFEEHAGVGGTGEAPYARWADADGRSSGSGEQGR